VVEIQGLESLFAGMAKDAPDRPLLIRRMASGYAELARVAAADHDALEGRPEAQLEAEKANKIRFAAHNAAAKYYTVLAQTYPGWCATPDAADPQRSTGCSDEAWYYAGYEHEARRQLDQARQAYLQAIQKGELRRFAAYAYLAFGELFIPEAESNPARWELAQQSFEEVLKYPPPDDDLHAYALLRLGQIHLRRGDRERAHGAFAKLRALASQRPAPATEAPARLVPPGE
jgi:tetratricopeptide (TPR) repeat protein